jgi:hypothetical protein
MKLVLQSAIIAKLPVFRSVHLTSALQEREIFDINTTGRKAKVFIDRFVAFEDRCENHWKAMGQRKGCFSP